MAKVRCDGSRSERNHRLRILWPLLHESLRYPCSRRSMSSSMRSGNDHGEDHGESSEGGDHDHHHADHPQQQLATRIDNARGGKGDRETRRKKQYNFPESTKCPKPSRPSSMRHWPSFISTTFECTFKRVPSSQRADAEYTVTNTTLFTWLSSPCPAKIDCSFQRRNQKYLRWQRGSATMNMKSVGHADY